MEYGGKTPPVLPYKRNSHTQVSYGSDTIYVFGGQDDDNNKLEDLWEFSISKK